MTGSVRKATSPTPKLFSQDVVRPGLQGSEGRGFGDCSTTIRYSQLGLAPLRAKRTYGSARSPVSSSTGAVGSGPTSALTRFFAAAMPAPGPLRASVISAAAISAMVIFLVLIRLLLRVASVCRPILGPALPPSRPWDP